MNKQGQTNDRTGNQELRMLKFLSKSVRSGVNIKTDKEQVKLSLYNGSQVFGRTVLSKVLAHGYAKKGQHTLTITRKGLDALTTDAGQKDSVTASSELKSSVKTGRQKPQFNDFESPLYRLHSRQLANGRKYLDEHEFAAGERLRIDFERGQLQPNVTSNLGISSGRSKGGGHYKSAEISDFAIDARNRFRAAVTNLSPELADVAIDICCFLKGFETVEREKQWPPRSAKLMLKTALAELSRHYGLSSDCRRSVAEIVGWGEDGYRPSIG